MSRRHMLSLTAAAAGGVTALTGKAYATPSGNAGAYRPAAGAQHTQQNRPYWEKTYSGGPIDVKPLPPGRPDKD
ncbi:MAG TPA: hypothetical protein VLK82_15005, partial [Candidatus Tectomicrobia bacterium]|nr:hypothetical protein [Candidatus Tectomicrobia bacterium]